MGSSMLELGIDRLTHEQRIALALEIWESLGEKHPEGLCQAQREELMRRDIQLDQFPERALTWEQIRAVETRRQ